MSRVITFYEYLHTSSIPYLLQGASFCSYKKSNFVFGDWYPRFFQPEKTGFNASSGDSWIWHDCKRTTNKIYYKI